MFISYNFSAFMSFISLLLTDCRPLLLLRFD
jgi:hypothetical protein